MEKKINPKWWVLDDQDAPAVMQSVVDAIITDSRGLHIKNVQNLRLYTSNFASDLSISNYIVTSQQAARNNFLQRGSRLNWNVVKSSIDSMTSKIAKEKIRPSFLTNGTWIDQKKRADRANDYLFGIMSNTGFYKESKQIFKDACIFGTAYAHVYREKCEGKYKIKCERIFPDEIIVDPYDSYYGNPKTLYRMKYLSKDVLRSWGVSETTIARLKCVSGFGRSSSSDDTVQVIQGWRLPIDGKHGSMMIVSDGQLIYREEYKRNCFPIVWWKYTEEPIGFYGKGVAEELTGDQVEINRLLNFIKDSMTLVSNPRVYIPIGSNVAKQNITNKIGGMIEYAGPTPPTISPSVAVSGDVFNQLDRLWARAFEKIGMNELQISGRNQLGAGVSGEALREHSDIQSERFAETQQTWEEFHCDIGKLFMLEAKEIHEAEGDYVVSVSSMDKGTFDLKYSDIKLPDDSYAIQVFPRSALPKMPGARMQYVSEMQQKGYIDTEQATELLNFPDLKAHNMLNEYGNLKEIIEKIITQDNPDDDSWFYIAPEPYFTLPLALELGRKYYVMLTCELPEETLEQLEDKTARLDLVRRWIDDCEKLMRPPEPEQPAAMPQGMPMPEQQMPMPQGMPMPEQQMTEEMVQQLPIDMPTQP